MNATTRIPKLNWSTVLEQEIPQMECGTLGYFGLQAIVKPIVECDCVAVIYIDCMQSYRVNHLRMTGKLIRLQICEVPRNISKSCLIHIVHWNMFDIAWNSWIVHIVCVFIMNVIVWQSVEQRIGLQCSPINTEWFLDIKQHVRVYARHDCLNLICCIAIRVAFDVWSCRGRIVHCYMCAWSTTFCVYSVVTCWF